MSRRLGERLVAKGLLEQGRLDEALQTQLMSGGTLGTTLLDLDLVDEEALGETLAELLRVKHAGREQLRDIPGEILKLLPVELAEKHHALPLGLEGKALDVAAVHPKHLGALSRSTGYKIVPWVAPEVRIHEALAKHYGVALRPRYVRLLKELEHRTKRGARVQVGVEDSNATVDLGQTAEIDMPAESFGYGRDWRSIAAELHGADSPEAHEQGGVATATRRERRSEDSGVAADPCRSVDDVLDRLCRADHKEELFGAVLDHLSQKLETCIVFGVRSHLASVWDWRGKKVVAERARAAKFPVTGGSIFNLLLGSSYYHGPPGDDPGCRNFFERMGMAVPDNVLLLPVYLNDRLIAVVYGDGGVDDEDVANYRQIAEKLSLALNLLILKMKIRS